MLTRSESTVRLSWGETYTITGEPISVALDLAVPKVSPGYAFEITTPEGGWNMDGILRERGYVLNGILNGIEPSEWSPENDKHIAMNYTWVAHFHLSLH